MVPAEPIHLAVQVHQEVPVQVDRRYQDQQEQINLRIQQNSKTNHHHEKNYTFFPPIYMS